MLKRPPVGTDNNVPCSMAVDQYRGYIMHVIDRRRIGKELWWGQGPGSPVVCSGVIRHARVISLGITGFTPDQMHQIAFTGHSARNSRVRTHSHAVVGNQQGWTYGKPVVLKLGNKD